MSAKGDMCYAWTKDAGIKGECGGAVTSLLKYALQNHIVDAVLTVKKGVDIYDPLPAFITDPKDLDACAGSLHCGTLLLPKLIKKYLNGAKDMKIAVTVKGCDAKAMYELGKRGKINMDNIFMIGLNCGGSVTPFTARTMILEKYGINPDDVVKEEIDKGQFIVMLKDGTHKGISIDELEEEGVGRRLNCQRCETKIPRQADIACGNWGVFGEKAGKATFVEICSEKGAKLFDGAVKAGIIDTCAPEAKGLEIRGKIENVMVKMGKKNQKKQFDALGYGAKRLEFMQSESSRCIKCYSCIEACPICSCTDCITKDPNFVIPGRIPPNFMFHMIRYAHVAPSCINCGQCQELCPMDIPNALFMHAMQTEIQELIGFGKPGYDMTPSPLAYSEDKKNSGFVFFKMP
ncbi:MAG: Coenzyme F420 hydrogenase/dehydrogenase, beta subunit C-terminal domain [Methanocorpusculum sp.]|uniref:Coenzyme F420 hydrogenase/dehydrogenase, beta subunit C-terminal domain n=1 Tax=Methanocorpusculum sp. TaxID=2058474 RepID=UPI0027166313|nr:Coenzyme F420 hydrogenase/dehydrogenase, beta subunit C-terminal domain [Methanocorpusculum sp.]MDO9523728.1 Coenzyme F420 hydrogenase/dehydrogenase, beta subunit C-terminal domain [Methanocorpusculum sp.]